MNPFYKNLALWLVISLMVILLFNMFHQPQRTSLETTYTQFLSSVQKGEVSEVTIQGDHIFGTLADGKSFKTFVPRDADMIRLLRDHGVSIKAKPEDESPWYMNVLVSWLPMLLRYADEAILRVRPPSLNPTWQRQRLHG